MRLLPIKERYFEMIDNTCWCFDKALKDADISVNYYRKEKSAGNKRIIFRDHPTDRRFSLVAFDSMSEAHKQKIIQRFGNPNIYVTRTPILRMIEIDDKAYQFFLDYRYNGGDTLPIYRIKQYSRAASWLNLLKKVNDSKNKIIKELGIKVDEFYQHIDALMNIEINNGENKYYDGPDQLPSRFPTSYRNLKPKLAEYNEKGPVVLISKMYGNQLAAKVNDEVAEAQLLGLIENPLQYDDVLVCKMYNEWAKKNGYKEIDSSTVGVRRRKSAAQIITGREGHTAFNERFIRQVKGARPSAPLFFVEHDDNNLDFLFRTKEDRLIKKYVSIVVTDSYCDLVLGYSRMIGKDPIPEMVYEAYLNAMYYIRHLTGGWHMPFEFKADKYAFTELKPFYNRLALFAPPSHGNKHRGYIEQFFQSNVWKRSQQLVSEGNWSGNNISAKYRGVNQDWLKDQQRFNQLPLISADSDLQIDNFFHLCRQLPDFTRENMNAPSKEQKWLEAWAALPGEKKRPITDEQFLLTFGIKHQPGGRKISINNRGVEPQINNNKYSYDLPEGWMYNDYVGEEVSVYYDPYDMSRVLITNEKDIRFIAKSATLVPRALKDHYEGSRTFLNSILAEKKDQVGKVAEKIQRRKEKLAVTNHDAEAVLQIGVLKKEVKNEAEHRFINMPKNDGQHENYLDDNYNFDEFFNQ